MPIAPDTLVAELIEALPVYVVRFELKPLEPLHFRTFPGVTIRGALCSVMKGLVCVARPSDCRECYVQRRCAFARLFVSMPPRDGRMMKLYPSAPHPFVLRYPEGWGRRAEYRDRLTFKLHLFGSSVETFPFILRTVERLQETGLGPDRAGFEFERVVAETQDGDRDMERDGSPPPWELHGSRGGVTEEANLSLRLRTPVRVRQDGKPASRLSFRTLVANLCRRLSALAYFAGGTELDWDYAGIVDRAGRVRTERDETRWEKFERYSSRQNRKMPFGGLLGQVTYGNVPGDLADIVRVGQFFGAGRHTTFGLGEYEVSRDG